ncbi:thioredoxin domain-containing protein [Erythrobacter sp. HL-111]|uniref:thioredoxin domain-containing protein n=1 Tax=Erythrobacter sp. HL-111 TaxID=1798193 RepID=UPI0006D9E533|nr:thioredoxin domain-containing protein [Erythrobacter sp. HL-111]KPP86214.1 MAG: Protein-disulfide isomerase [Erythrobacteraceae bacterium HL-111]SDS21345.1 Protein-disulfide isomerase [Erythrobacter sp. HL-111]
MIPTRIRLAPALIAAPLVLALAACEGEEGDVAEGATGPIEPVAAPEGTSWTETVTVSGEGGAVLGNPDAPLKLVEYASHTCGACAAFATQGKPELKRDYIAAGTVSIEQREVFLNTFDVVLARMIQCGPPERVHALSDEVWTNLGPIMGGVQQNPEAVQAAGELPMEQRFVRIAEVAGFLDFFAARGLSADEARMCLSDTDAVEAMVREADRLAQADEITGTPTFLLNGQRVDGPQWSAVESALQDAGARPAE